MRISVTLDARFYRTPDGKVWGLRGYDFWEVYLRYFEQLNVVARVQNVTEKAKEWKQSCGSRVEFADIPYFVGFAQYLSKHHAVYRAVEAAIRPTDAVLARSGNCLDGVLYPILRKRKQVYGVQLVNSPYELFKKEAYYSPFRPLLNWYFPRQIRRLCHNASCLTSVSKTVLQQFQSGSHLFCNYFSDVVVSEKTLRYEPKQYDNAPKPAKLLFVGSLANLRKAPNLLIEAVAQCTQSGCDIHLTIIGDGQERTMLEVLTDRLSVNDNVTFTGNLPGPEAVRGELEKADLFVLPSYVEGLPRAMVEAMASGLPCIGTKVSGIPELLDEEDLVPPGDVNALAQKIKEIISSPKRLTTMSARNLKAARNEYRSDILHARESDFFSELKRVAQIGKPHTGSS